MRKNRFKLVLAAVQRVFLAAAAVHFLTLPALAIQVTNESPLFSIGLGFTNTLFWSDVETAAANTPTNQGSFTFSPSVTSDIFSFSGPGFPGRVMTSNGGACGYNESFLVTLNASYTGAAPLDAAPVPNYRLLITVTNISMHFLPYDTPSLTTTWTETTPGNTQTSATKSGYANLGVGGNWQLGHFYEKHQWDPSDTAVTLVGLNDNVTRTFSILEVATGSSTTWISMDGFEVWAKVALIYESVIPEPSVAMLLLVSGGLLAWRRTGRAR